MILEYMVYFLQGEHIEGHGINIARKAISPCNIHAKSNMAYSLLMQDQGQVGQLNKWVDWYSSTDIAIAKTLPCSINISN